MFDICSDLAEELEHYLCHLLNLVPLAKANNWWCDGVMELSITRLSRTEFEIRGIAWAMNDHAPFDLQFQYAERRGTVPLRIRLRMGATELHGQVRKLNKTAVDKLLTAYPRRDWNWAVDVEFTPP